MERGFPVVQPPPKIDWWAFNNKYNIISTAKIIFLVTKKIQHYFILLRWMPIKKAIEYTFYIRNLYAFEFKLNKQIIGNQSLKLQRASRPFR